MTKGAAAPRRKTTKKAATETCAAPLIVSISGVRGIAGASLTPEAVLPYLLAFARMQKGNRIVVGRDARPSARWLQPLVISALRAEGIDVIDVDLCPTPTVGMMTRKLRASGGICITASHNPIEYNGLKFFQSNGQFINAEMLAQLKDLMANPPVRTTAPKIGALETCDDAGERHLETLLSAIPPPKKPRGARTLKVIIDCCNSAGATIAPDVADAYGSEFQVIHADTHSYTFPRGPEPVPANLGKLRKAVLQEKADIGFAIDPDADRLALIDEKGRPLGEERTIVLAADAFLLLSKKKSPLVVNLSTSLAMNDLAARHGVALHRTAIGEANVVKQMTAVKARIGGEGNGGVIVPAVQPGRDAATAIALILIGLQQRGGTLSEWNASIPNYAMEKAAIPLGNVTVARALKSFKEAFRQHPQDTTDGVKVTMEDRWVHLRPSNTEPIMRIFAEAPDKAAATDLIEKAAAAIR